MVRVQRHAKHSHRPRVHVSRNNLSIAGVFDSRVWSRQLSSCASRGAIAGPSGCAESVLRRRREFPTAMDCRAEERLWVCGTDLNATRRSATDSLRRGPARQRFKKATIALRRGISFSRRCGAPVFHAARPDGPISRLPPSGLKADVTTCGSASSAKDANA